MFFAEKLIFEKGILPKKKRGRVVDCGDCMYIMNSKGGAYFIAATVYILGIQRERAFNCGNCIYSAHYIIHYGANKFCLIYTITMVQITMSVHPKLGCK